MSPLPPRRRRGGTRRSPLVRWTLVRTAVGLLLAAIALRQPQAIYAAPIAGAVLDLLIGMRR